MGRNTGNRVSNAIFGDKWSTPYRVGVNDRKSTSKKRKNSGNEDAYDVSSPSRRRKSTTSRGKTTPYYSSEMKSSGISMDFKDVSPIVTDYLNFHKKTKEALQTELRRIKGMSIPRNEDSLVNMLQSLSVNFSSVNASLSSNSFDYQKELMLSSRDAIFSKYSHALTALETYYPHNPFLWSFIFRKWRMFFARKPWSWIKWVYGTILLAGSYNAIAFKKENDVLLISILWGIPLTLAIFNLLLHFLRRR